MASTRERYPIKGTIARFTMDRSRIRTSNSPPTNPTPPRPEGIPRATAFAVNPLAGTVGPMFLVITILEVSAGALSGVGCALLILTRDSTVAYLGAVLGGVNIVALFFGQRVAKDYAGAAALVPYFLLALTAIYLLAER